jgi:hypothetical protein
VTKRHIIVLSTIVIALAAGVALFLWTDFLRTTATITVKNETSEAVVVGIGDDGIGCRGARSVAANTTAQVKLTLQGVNVLCLHSSIDVLSVTSDRGTTRDCDWSMLRSNPSVVVTDTGPDCAR